MLALAGRRKLGVIRIEYLAAGAVCAMLLSGMTAVLVVRSGSGSSRATARALTPAPSAPRETRHTSPSVSVSPSTPTVVAVPSQTIEIPVVRPAESPRPSDSSATPTVVVIPAGGASTAAPSSGTTKAYPSGVAPVLAQGSALRIEAEDFDSGGEGTAYHDTSPANEGRVYRPNEGVDISSSQDPSGGGYVISYIRPGEWWNYSIRVQDPGDYHLKLRVARLSYGDAKARMRIDGFDKTGEITIPSTGSFSTYQTVDAGVVHIGSTGVKVFRLEAMTGEWNLNWIEFSSSGGSGSSNGPVVVTIPAAGSSNGRPTNSSTAAPVVIEVAGGSSASASAKPSTPSTPSVSGLPVVAEDDFANDKLNVRPAGAGWSWGGAGSMTVQTLPGETTKCLRLVDTNQTGDTWIKRTFSARKERIVWTGKIRFGPSADGVGVTLMDGEKPAAIAYIESNEFGVQSAGGAWSAVKAASANTWYDLRIEIDIKGKSCTYEFDGTTKKVKLVKDVPQVNAWALMGAGPTIGTVYVSSVKVQAK